MIAPFKKHGVTDLNLFRVQENVEAFSRPLVSNPTLDGMLLERVVLASGPNRIPHKLGRTLRGWTLTRIRGAVGIYDLQDTLSQSEQTTFLCLQSSGPVTVDLWVF